MIDGANLPCIVRACNLNEDTNTVVATRFTVASQRIYLLYCVQQAETLWRHNSKSVQHLVRANDTWPVPGVYCPLLSKLKRLFPPTCPWAVQYAERLCSPPCNGDCPQRLASPACRRGRAVWKSGAGSAPASARHSSSAAAKEGTGGGALHCSEGSEVPFRARSCAILFSGRAARRQSLQAGLPLRCRGRRDGCVPAPPAARPQCHAASECIRALHRRSHGGASYIPRKRKAADPSNQLLHCANNH